MDKLLYIGLGGAIGSILRYMISSLDFRYSCGVFPVSTLIVNLAGSFVIGLLWGLFEVSSVPLNIRLFLLVGLLGGFTTFSSFALENLNLLRDGERLIAFSYIGLTNVLGLVLVFTGLYLSRVIIAFAKGV